MDVIVEMSYNIGILAVQVAMRDIGLCAETANRNTHFSVGAFKAFG